MVRASIEIINNEELKSSHFFDWLIAKLVNTPLLM